MPLAALGPGPRRSPHDSRPGDDVIIHGGSTLQARAARYILQRPAGPAPTTRWLVGYSERRKLRTSCFWVSLRLLNFLITAFASDASPVLGLPL